MADFKKIKVMISSRCNDAVSYKGGKHTLSDVRSDLKVLLESECLLGEKIFDVWINEDPPAPSAVDDSWEVCMKQIKECHILLVLNNGHAGWSKSAGDIGICHAELQTAFGTEPAKVYMLKLPDCVPPTDPDEVTRNKRFQDYCNGLNLFRGSVSTGEEVIEQCKKILRQAVADMVALGQREARKGKFHSGEALDWSRLDFQRRKEAMENVVTYFLLNQKGSSAVKSRGVATKISGTKVHFIAHGIPAALSVAAAKEMVGQPFLSDHTHDTKGVVGPVHIIACQKSVTELQAMKLLGFPDAVIVAAPFGVYAADNIQKIQMIFLSNCRDDTTTRHAAQRCLEWLDSTGESAHLASRAKSRTAISKAIAKELK